MTGRWILCIYCNEEAYCLDHFLPVASRAGRRSGYKDCVPSCSDCNEKKGWRVFETVGEAQDYIAHKLRIKHKKLLASPHWRADEIDSLGRNLKSSVTYIQTKKHTILRRLNYLENEQKYWIHLDEQGRLQI